MTEKLKQIIEEEVGKLSKEARDVVSSLEWVKISGEIGRKFLLMESEINDFQVETLLVLIGLEDGNRYALNIENNVGTSKDEAEKMAEEAYQKIFSKINDALEGNIKKSLKDKNPNPVQMIDFILSGGDYSVFMTPTVKNSPPEIRSSIQEDGKEETVTPVFSIREENLKRKI